MDNTFYFGSICLSDIPKELIKEFNGKKYLNISISAMREPKTFTNKNGGIKTFTHYVSCKPRKEEVVEGVNYYIGNLESRDSNQTYQSASQSSIPAPPAPPATPEDDLPF